MKKIWGMLVSLFTAAAALFSCTAPVFAAARDKTVSMCGERYSINSVRLDLSDKELTGNDIKQLKKFRKLESLDLSREYDRVETLDFSGIWELKGLKSLDISGNRLYLDGISKLTGLESLTARDISVERRSGSKAPSGGDDSLNEIGSLTGLLSLDISNNDFIAPDFLTDLTKLKTLRIDHVYFTHEPKELPQQLEILSAAAVRPLPMSVIGKLGRLRELNISRMFNDGEVDDLSPLGELKNLKTLDMGGILFSSSDFLKNLTGLETLRISGRLTENDLENISCLKKLNTLDAPYAGISDISFVSGLTDMQRLSLPGNKIDDLTPLTGLTKLEYLYLAENPVSDISPLSGLVNIKELYLNNCEISDIAPLKKMTKTEILRLNKNSITSTDALKGLTKLKELDISENFDLTDISPLKGCTSLESLSASHCKIEDISAVGGMKELTLLSLGFNEISDISLLSGLAGLEYVYLDRNEITDISPLCGLKKLERISARFNNIEKLPDLKECKNLTCLMLEKNRLSDISGAAGCTELVQFDIGRNEVADISAVKGMSKLEIFSANDNKITDISPLENLKKLEKLELGGNKIKDHKPLLGLKRLHELDIRQSGISEKQALELDKKLNCLIYSEFIYIEIFED